MYVVINLHIIWNTWLQILQSVLLSCPWCWPVVVTTETSSRPLSRVHCSQCGCPHLSLNTVPASPPCPQCRDEGVPCLRRAAAQPRRPHLGPGRGQGGQTQALAQGEDGEAEGGHDNNNNVQCQPRLRVQDLFWFRTTEDEAGQAACSAVDEASVEIVPGPPGDTCQVQYSAVQCSTVQPGRPTTVYPLSSHQEDGARFCFCGKKGAAETTNWKFICGT